MALLIPDYENKYYLEWHFDCINLDLETDTVAWFTKFFFC